MQPSCFLVGPVSDGEGLSTSHEACRLSAACGKPRRESFLFPAYLVVAATVVVLEFDQALGLMSSSKSEKLP